MLNLLPSTPRAAWVAALRSGQYTQHKESLANSDRTAFCCLGVMCDITPGFVWTELRANDGLPADEITERYGLVVASGHPIFDLTSANDSGSTFPEIADLVAKMEPEK